MGVEAGTALLIGAALTAGTTLIAQSMKPDAPGVPSPGPPAPGVPGADRAAADAAAIRLRARQRRTLESLRIDPAAAGSAGIQIPGLQ